MSFHEHSSIWLFDFRLVLKLCSDILEQDSIFLKAGGINWLNPVQLILFAVVSKWLRFCWFWTSAMAVGQKAYYHWQLRGRQYHNYIMMHKGTIDVYVL